MASLEISQKELKKSWEYFPHPLTDHCQSSVTTLGMFWLSACRTCSLSPWRLTCIISIALRTHWQAQLEAHLHGCRPKIKVETTLGANAGCIEQGGSKTSKETDRQMHRLTENDRMIEKSTNVREWEGKGSGLTVEISFRFFVR